MDFELDDALRALQIEAHEVGRSAAASLDIREDSWIRGTSPAFSVELARRGWLGMTWPTEWGGGGRSALERFVVYEALISEGAPVATTWFADRQMGPTILQFGTDRQREEYLPGIIAGTTQWSIGMSEPDAGSDVASIRTRAERRGDRWVVNGRKVWTSGAATSDLIYLVARTDPDAPPHAGLSEFIVDMSSPGISVRPIHDMSGDRHFCEVILDEVEVPAEHLVGAENGSFKQIMRQMEHERGGIDRLVSNRRLYLDVVDTLRADQRCDQRIRQSVARFEGGYRIGRNLVLREVLGQAPAGFSAITKTWCTEFEVEVAAFCVAMAGPAGMLQGRAARNICYAPGYTIMGGTTQILRNICGERILGLPR